MRSAIRTDHWFLSAGLNLFLIGALVIGGTARSAPELKKELALDLGGGVTMEFVLIQPGSFIMGSDKESTLRATGGKQESGYLGAQPAHKVTITQPFYLGKYEVTQEQWQSVMGNNPTYYPTHMGARNPVECISWEDCQEFLTKLNEKTRLAEKVTGLKAELPTEAQWEYACRAGSTSDYHHGDSEADLGEYAWYQGNSSNKTHPVGEKKPNAWGLYDMHGNLWEWCHDLYGPYESGDQTDPTGAPNGTERVWRGGSWHYGAHLCRSADRSFHCVPSLRRNRCGARVALNFSNGATAPAASAAAAPTPTENHVLRSTPVPRPVQIDGDLGEWDLSGAIVMADNRGQPRQAVRVVSMYDAAGLYLAFEFADPTPMVNHADPETAPGRAWCGDAVQVRFCTADDGVPPTPLQIVHVDGYWFTDRKQPVAYVVYGAMGPGGRASDARVIEQAVGQGIKLAFRPRADGQGYVQEMLLDWDLIRPGGKAYEAGQSLRMVVEALWGDARYKEQPATRVADLLNPKLPERKMLYTKPAAFGLVQFVPQGNLPPSDTAPLWAKRAQPTAPPSKTAAPTTSPTTPPVLRMEDPVAPRLKE